MKMLTMVVAGTGAILVAVSGVAVAQDPSTTITADATVSPSKAGTKKKPQGVKLTVKVKWSSPADIEKPVTQRAIAFFPKGSLYNGSKYPKCSQDQLSRGGPQSCPPKSIMGKGTGTAFADQVLTVPKITVVNGGGNMVYLYTVLNNPARVQAPVPGKITKMRGKYAYKLELTIPRNLQIVAGVPIALRDITITAGGKSWAKDWLATTSCGAGNKWQFKVQTFFNTGGSATFDDSVPCKK